MGYKTLADFARGVAGTTLPLAGSCLIDAAVSA
jgi:hypothetical protein